MLSQPPAKGLQWTIVWLIGWNISDYYWLRWLGKPMTPRTFLSPNIVLNADKIIDFGLNFCWKQSNFKWYYAIKITTLNPCQHLQKGDQGGRNCILNCISVLSRLHGLNYEEKTVFFNKSLLGLKCKIEVDIGKKIMRKYRILGWKFRMRS